MLFNITSWKIKSTFRLIIATKNREMKYLKHIMRKVALERGTFKTRETEKHRITDFSLTTKKNEFLLSAKNMKRVGGFHVLKNRNGEKRWSNCKQRRK